MIFSVGDKVKVKEECLDWYFSKDHLEASIIPGHFELNYNNKQKLKESLYMSFMLKHQHSATIETKLSTGNYRIIHEGITMIVEPHNLVLVEKVFDKYECIDVIVDFLREGDITEEKVKQIAKILESE